MTTERVQVTLHTDDANPANYATNTWYINSDGSQGRIDAANAIEAFYNELDGYYASTVAQNGHDLVMYDMEDPEPRAPVFEATFNLDTNPTSNPLPSECAVCMSFQAERVSGQQQSRRRGRLYLGPLGVITLDTSGRPTGTFAGEIRDAAETLLATSATDTTWFWVVYSTVNADVSFVDNGWIDNSFDTQRRRGLEYTSRTLFSA